MASINLPERMTFTVPGRQLSDHLHDSRQRTDRACREDRRSKRSVSLTLLLIGLHAAVLLNPDHVESKPFSRFSLPNIGGDERNRETRCRLKGQCRRHMQSIEGPQTDSLDEFLGLA